MVLQNGNSDKGFFTATPSQAILGSIGTTLQFNTSGLGRMLIDVNGKVGIGTDSPSSKLHVKGDEIIEQTNATTLLILRDATYTGDQYLSFSQEAPSYTISAGCGLN